VIKEPSLENYQDNTFEDPGSDSDDGVKDEK